jgi:SSS family transporter
LKLAAVDYVILATYFAFVIGIGWMLRKKVSTSGDFLLSGRSVPVWITSLAFIAANLGAQELIGMAASGAKYGIMTAHFYWVGAIPAMLFMGIFMMPFYYGSKARSVPEYLKMRFDEKTRGYNAFTFAVMTVFSSGISMYALGLLLHLVLNWDFNVCVLASAAIVLAYTYLGGLTSAIYNEVLQFFLIVAGFAPLAILACAKAGGWHGIVSRLPANMTHSWKYMGSASQNPMGVELFGMVAGLGFVLSFGYWCTNFLVVQRAMAADSMSAARRTPLIGTIPKMFLPFIVILPGIAAVALAKMTGAGGAHLYDLPLKAGGTVKDYDQVLTTLMARFYPAGLLGVGLTGLMASFMSGMAGNVTAFNTVFTYDIYQSYIRKSAPDSDDHRRRGALHRRGVCGAVLQQHHGPAAVRLRLRERPAVCHIPAGHVLEADHGARRVFRVGERYSGRVAHLGTYGGRRQRRHIRHAPHVPLRDGAELLDRDCGFRNVLPGHRSSESGDRSAYRSGYGRFSVRPHEDQARRGRQVVAAPRAARDLRLGPGDLSEHLVRIIWISECLRAGSS